MRATMGVRSELRTALILGLLLPGLLVANALCLCATSHAERAVAAHADGTSHCAEREGPSAPDPDGHSGHPGHQCAPCADAGSLAAAPSDGADLGVRAHWAAFAVRPLAPVVSIAPTALGRHAATSTADPPSVLLRTTVLLI